MSNATDLISDAVFLKRQQFDKKIHKNISISTLWHQILMSGWSKGFQWPYFFGSPACCIFMTMTKKFETDNLDSDNSLEHNHIKNTLKKVSKYTKAYYLLKDPLTQSSKSLPILTSLPFFLFIIDTTRQCLQCYQSVNKYFVQSQNKWPAQIYS